MENFKSGTYFHIGKTKVNIEGMLIRIVNIIIFINLKTYA